MGGFDLGAQTTMTARLPEAATAELELWPRQHDLPPRWDGLPIEWGEWSDTADVFICPPPRERTRCSQCGSDRRPRMSLGRVLTELAVVDKSTSVRPASVARVVANLALFRCPECEHDYVLDFANDEAWDLDRNFLRRRPSTSVGGGVADPGLVGSRGGPLLS